LAKNRYGWNKRVKELARKMKQEEKRKRRQNKSQEKPTEQTPEEGSPDNPYSEHIED
jgi:Sec-independent protein translocase protein TatA